MKKEKVIYDGEGNVLVTVGAPGDGKAVKLPHFQKIKEWLTISNIAVFISIFTAVVLVLAGINSISKYVYYGINLSLFRFDNQYIFVEAFKFILTWFLILVLPFIFYNLRQTESSVQIPKACFFLLIVLGVRNFYADLIGKYLKIYFELSLPEFAVLISIVLALYFVFYNLKFLFQDDIQMKTHASKWKSFVFKSLWVFKFLFLLIKFICAVVVYASLCNITFFNLVGVPQPNTYTEYSIVKQEFGDKIVLFKADDKLFIADYIIEGENATIYTKKYQVIPFENVELTDVRLKDIQIEKEQPKPEE